MADTLSVVVGVGITSFLLFYLSNQFGTGQNDMGRQILQLLAVCFGVLLLLVIPNALFDSQTVCNPVPMNETVNGNVTTIEYGTFCYTEELSTLTGFHKIILWFFRVFIFLLMLRLAWMVLQLFMGMGGSR